MSRSGGRVSEVRSAVELVAKVCARVASFGRMAAELVPDRFRVDLFVATC